MSSEEAACAISRSMWETIVAAVSTFALFLTANWGSADLLQDATSKWITLPGILQKIEGTLDQMLMHTLFSFGMPFLSNMLSFKNATGVSEVKRELVSIQKRLGMRRILDSGAIAIMAVCPTYIRFPASALTDDQERSLKRRRYTDRSFDGLRDECPLELRPSLSVDVNPAIRSNAGNNTGEANSAINRSAIDDNGAVIDEEDPNQWKCFQVPMDEKAVLLALGLTPTYGELRFLRSRSRFQSIVTALQAAGYILTVVQRALQHLAISPLEAFVTFLCIITALQLLVELYAPSHYQCPLLLRLNPGQFCRLRDYVPATDTAEVTAYERIEAIVRFASLLGPWVLVLGLSMYYFVHYLHAHLLSALSALLFFLAHCSLFFSPGFMPNDQFCIEAFGYLSLLPYYVMYASSMIVAMVSTIVQWEAFQKANTKVWYAWILPHVSS